MKLAHLCFLVIRLSKIHGVTKKPNLNAYKLIKRFLLTCESTKCGLLKKQIIINGTS